MCSAKQSTGSNTQKGANMVAFFNRKGMLYVQFTTNGKKYQRSTKLEDTAKNRAFVKKEVIPKLTLKILDGSFDDNKKKQEQKIGTFYDYAKLYLKSKDKLKSYNDLSNIINNQLFPLFKNKKINEIRRSDIKRFSDKKLDSVSPKRVRVMLGVLSGIFTIALDYEDIITNPALEIKLPNQNKKEEYPFTPSEVESLINSADGWFKNYLAFAFFTGARVGELIALQWCDINLDNGTISINKAKRHGVLSTTKTKYSERDIPIFDVLIPFIKDQMSKSKTIWVFANPRTGNSLFGSKTLAPIWKKVVAKAGVKETRLYNTRHTFITNMLKQGELSILDIAQIAGHSNTEMIVRNYAKYIKGEHLKIRRDLNPFTDKSADSIVQTS